MVRLLRKYTIVLASLITLIFVFVSFTSPKVSTGIDDYYTKAIAEVRKNITLFQQGSGKKESLSALKKAFLRARLSYKKLAVLTEYFNPYETRLLNGPALNWSEENTPDEINPPKGFQVIEELLYNNWNNKAYSELDGLLQDIQQTLTRLENEPDRTYKFKDELVWDALRSAVLRLITMGITGFDSPVSNNSLTEARATLEGIKNILPFFRERFGKSSPFADIYILLSKASGYLQSHNNFSRFDRLTFITQFADTIYRQLNAVRVIGKIGIPQGSNPINFTAASIFDERAFDINFFSSAKEYWLTPERVALGKKLFYDPVLSGTRTRSCATCHQPEKAFADGLKTPLAIDDKSYLLRNTPTLWNSVYQTRQFYDSRTDLLENQLMDVVHNTGEMKGSLKENVEELKKSIEYVTLFRNAYPLEPQPLNVFTIGSAVSSYVRSLSALNSRFDQYMRGDKTQLTITERNGFNLFTGKAKCATCHYLPLFNGLVPPHFIETESEVLGVPKTNSKISAEPDDDPGKFKYSRSPIHKNAFKTPTLRNIELTAPYMHNGVYKTLEEVMDFYNNGGGAGLKIRLENQTLPPGKLKLSKKEISDVIAFMKSLTDTTAGKVGGSN